MSDLDLDRDAALLELSTDTVRAARRQVIRRFHDHKLSRKQALEIFVALGVATPAERAAL